MQSGIAVIEVPLNSPDPFTSIATLRRSCARATLVGAGTVTRGPSTSTHSPARILPMRPAHLRGTSCRDGCIVDLLADESVIDPVELRRRNFIQPDHFPFDTLSGEQYDSGDYDKALSRALELIDYDGIRRLPIRLAGAAVVKAAELKSNYAGLKG